YFCRILLLGYDDHGQVFNFKILRIVKRIELEFSNFAASRVLQIQGEQSFVEVVAKKIFRMGKRILLGFMNLVQLSDQCVRRGSAVRMLLRKSKRAGEANN